MHIETNRVMGRNKVYRVLVMLAVVLMSCSTQKNTWSTRAFHQMKTKYNIYFNGQLAFNEGEEATREANEDDYSTILNLYPV